MHAALSRSHAALGEDFVCSEGTPEQRRKHTRTWTVARAKLENVMKKFILATSKSLEELRALGDKEFDDEFAAAHKLWMNRLYAQYTPEKIAKLRKGKLSISRLDCLMRAYARKD